MFQAVRKKTEGHDFIRMAGSIDPEELHELTCRSRMGYNVLDNTSKNYDESLPNKTFDYINAEIPQLISNSRQLVKYNTDIPFACVSELSVESLSQCINQLLNDAGHYKKLVDNCRTLKNKFVWELESQRLTQYYLSI